MDSNDQEKTQSEALINDENNNLKKLFSSPFEGQKTTANDKEKNETTMLIPRRASSSDDELWDSSTSSSHNEKELVSSDQTKLWNDVSPPIKCLYRENFKEFSPNSYDLTRIENSLRILTELDDQWLFEQLETIVVEFVNEIRDEVLKRFQICEKSSTDIQLFISYLLDEYYSFVQAAQNVSQLVSSLEENYLKKFQLTWLLYNKHLYEEFVYMDKKIHQSLSKMIDFLQPTSDQPDFNDYSPADFSQLLNRFLAFDEEMSEVACLYKATQQKRQAWQPSRTNGSQRALPSNGSSVESGLDETREISSMSSVDEYLLEHQISSGNLLEEQTKEPIEPPVPVPTSDEDPSKTDETKKTKSSRRKENATLSLVDPLLTFSKGILGSDLILPRKPPLTTASKLQADFRPLTMSLLSKAETTSCPPFFPAKIQSASFTATTFGSITTTNEAAASKNAARLNVHLRPKVPLTSPINSRNLEEMLFQTNPTGLDLPSFISKNSKKSETFSDSHWSECDDCPRTNPRLQIRLTKPSTVEAAKKKILKGKPMDENIDELVKFIDGEETTTGGSGGTTKEAKSKKTKKKKGKQNRTADEPALPTVTSDEPAAEPTEEVMPEKTLQTRRTSTPSIPSTADSPGRSLSPSEEEQQINWITISRKAAKQKPTIAPGAPPAPSNKTKRQTKANADPSQKTNPNSKLSVQPKPTAHAAAPTTKPTTNAQLPQPSIPKVQQPTSCWKKIPTAAEIPPVDVGKSKSTLAATAAAFIPAASRLNSNPSNDASSSSFVPYSTDSSSRTEWDFSSYLLPSTFSSPSKLIPPPPPPPLPGPVQRPTGSFSSLSSNACIQRPSSEPRSSPFPFYSSSIYNEENSQSIWTNNSSSNSNESLWPSSQEPPMRTSPTFDDFPLYDPFKSGTGLAIPLSSSLPLGFEDSNASFSKTNNPIGHHLHGKNDFQDLSFENHPSNYWEN